jgi:uncharacterized protein YydD (DUF2326 family)
MNNSLNEGTFATEGNLSDCGEEDELVKKINALFEEVEMYQEADEDVEEDYADDQESYCVQFENLGRLKKTLSRKCPRCNAPLEIRTYQEGCVEDGEEYLKDIDYVECKNKNCDYTEDIEPKRKRSKGKDKVKNFKYSDEDGLDADRNNKRKSTQKNNGRDSRRSNK